MALRITKQGLEAIGVKNVAEGAPTETSVSPAPDRTEVKALAVEVVASRKRASVATQKSDGSSLRKAFQKHLINHRFSGKL